MARRRSEPSVIFVREYLGGLNTRSFNSRIADNQVSAGVLNSRLTEDGVFGKRLGVEHYGTVGSLASSTYCGGLGTYYTSSVKHLLADFGPWLTKYNGTLFTPVSGATFTVGNDKNFVTARGDLYIHNGVDMMTKYDGTALTRLTASGSASSLGASVPAGAVVGKFGIFFKTSHIVSGNPTYPNRAFVSEAGDSSKFVLNNQDGNATDQAQWYDVAKDDGDIMTGLAAVQDSTIFFKERAVYEGKYNTNISAQTGGVSGTTNFYTSILPLNKGIGCVAHRTVDSIENDLVFLSRNGPAVYLLGQQANLSGLRLTEISQPIKNILEGISQSNYAKPSGIYHNKRYYLSIPFGSTTVNNYVLVFNREYGVWEGVWQGVNANSFTSFIDPNDSNNEKLLIADGNARRIGKTEDSAYTDFSSAIQADFYFKNFDLQTPGLYKRWNDLTLFFRNTVATVTVTVYIDGQAKRVKTFTIGYANSTSGIGSGIIGKQIIGDGGGGTDATSETTTDRRIKINKRGRSCQVRIQNSTAGERFSLHSMEIGYRLSYGRGNYPSANRVS